jgi:hypothetical protein
MWGQRGYAYRGGWGHPGGFFLFPLLPLLFVGLVLFGVIKFFWPLLLLGFVFFMVRSAMHGHRGHGRRHGFGRGWGGRPGAEFGFGPGHGWHGHHGHWGWDDEDEKSKRKNDDHNDDEKPKRDGRTLYV